MKMTKKIIGVLSGCGILLAVSLHAQPVPSTSIQQKENFQNNMEQQQPLIALKAGTNAPEVYTGENADIGPQHILRVMQHRSLFEVSFDTEYLYTDNALLSQGHGAAASVWVNTVNAAFAPTPYKWGPGRFAPAVGFISQWYNYWNVHGGTNSPDVTKADFNVQTFYARAAYLFPDNWTAFAQFDYNRFLGNNDFNDEFYHDFTPELGVQRLFQIRDNLLLSANFDTQYHFSWQNNTPNDEENRWENTVGLALSYQLTPKLVFQPYYRLEYTYYEWNGLTVDHQPGRNDLLNSAGISASYYFTPAFSLRAFANYDAKITDDNNTPSYRDFSVGLNLNYTFRF